MEKPKKCISVSEARELQNIWKKSRGKEIERGQGYEDTRDFWYSIAELEEYLNYVKEKSAEQGVKNPGIRIYLSAYPKKEQKKSYTTIFLAATKEENTEAAEGGDVNNYEIEPLNDSAGGIPPKDY